MRQFQDYFLSLNLSWRNFFILLRGRAYRVGWRNTIITHSVSHYNMHNRTSTKIRIMNYRCSHLTGELLYPPRTLIRKKKTDGFRWRDGNWWGRCEEFARDGKLRKRETSSIDKALVQRAEPNARRAPIRLGHAVRIPERVKVRRNTSTRPASNVFEQQSPAEWRKLWKSATGRKRHSHQPLDTVLNQYDY